MTEKVEYICQRECPKCGKIYDPTYEDRFCTCGSHLLPKGSTTGIGRFFLGRKGTYENIQSYIALKYGVTAKTCWIAEVKEAYGLTRGPDSKRIGTRIEPCPKKHWDKIVEALCFFGILKSYKKKVE